MNEKLVVFDDYGDTAMVASGGGFWVLVTSGTHTVMLNENTRRALVIFLMASLPEYSQIPPSIRRRPVWAW